MLEHTHGPRYYLAKAKVLHVPGSSSVNQLSSQSWALSPLHEEPVLIIYTDTMPRYYNIRTVGYS